MLKIFAEGKELKYYPITADENYTSHAGLGGLISMGGGIQYALDFGVPVNLDITTNMDGKVIQRGSDLGNYIAVDFGEYQVCFVHVFMHDRWVKGSVIKAGTPICSIAPTNLNGGYAVHLHIYATKNYKPYKIRDIIFYTEPAPAPDLSAEVASLKAKVATLTQTINTLTAEKSVLTGEKAALNASVVALTDQMNQFKKDIEQCAVDKNKLVERAVNAENRVVKLQEEVERLSLVTVDNMKLSDVIRWIGKTLKSGWSA